MSAAQSSQFFGRMKSAFQASSPTGFSPAIPTVVPTATPVTQSANTDLTLLEEAIAEAEQQAARAIVASTPVIADTPSPALPLPTPPPPAQPLVANPLDAVAQAVPSVIAQQTDTLNAGHVSPTPKEVWQNLPQALDAAGAEVAQPVVENLASSSAPETTAQAPVEAGATAQYVEVEPPSPEIPVEVEGYLQEVKDHQDQLPQEIVIAADQFTLQPSKNQPLRPVVVLPITPEMEAVGVKKNPTWSLKWLVMWSRKLMKMFAGKIVYHPEEAT